MLLSSASAHTRSSYLYRRSVGGIRVSLYNAISEEQTDQLVSYIREFLTEES